MIDVCNDGDVSNIFHEKICGAKVHFYSLEISFP
jgi:hypothetical protein